MGRKSFGNFSQVKNMYEKYTIKRCRNFYGIFLYGELIQTADTYREARDDLEELLRNN